MGEFRPVKRSREASVSGALTGKSPRRDRPDSKARHPCRLDPRAHTLRANALFPNPFHEQDYEEVNNLNQGLRRPSLPTSS